MQITKLDCGIRLVYEKLPHSKSVSVGIWIGSGTINETEKFWGISHFIEHMLFKGTVTRTAKDIAVSMDKTGGQLNAFTAHDCTCVYSKTLAEDLDFALELIADMILNSKFDKKDIATEKTIVEEEIDMYEDNPEELAHDILAGICFEGHSLGWNILGSHESVNSFDKKLIKEYMDLRYCADEIVISVAGAFDEDSIKEKCEKYFGTVRKEKSINLVTATPEYNKGEVVRYKEIEQAHIAIGLPGLCYNDPKMYAHTLICNVLGGSMSSRLFQHIREEKGLAYSVYSFPNVFKNGGYTSIYAGCNAENIQTVSAMIEDELYKIHKIGITKREFEDMKQHLKAGIILASESAGNRMSTMGKQLILRNKIVSDEEVIKIVENLSMEDVENCLYLFNPDNISKVILMPKQ